MNLKRIVFPTDFSHCSDAALEFATSLARDSGGTLFIVHAEEPPIAYGEGGMYYGKLEPDHVELNRMLHEVLPTDPSVACEHRLLVGDQSTAEQIVKFAKELKADIIVIGTHGRTGVKRMLIGSVAEAIMRRATCPVLIIKQGTQKPVRIS